MANPGYRADGTHPWDDIFVANADGTYTCGPCLPDDVDPGANDVQVWDTYSRGWTGPVLCCKCKLSIPVYVEGEAAVEATGVCVGCCATDRPLLQDRYGGGFVCPCCWTP
jgi:hypothetical protein